MVVSDMACEIAFSINSIRLSWGCIRYCLAGHFRFGLQQGNSMPPAYGFSIADNS